MDFNLIDYPNTNLSDADLASYISEFRRDNPDVGEAMAVGFIRARGYRVARARVRRALRSHDQHLGGQASQGGVHTLLQDQIPYGMLV